MKKIPSLFKRDYEGTRRVYDEAPAVGAPLRTQCVLNEVVPGCEWVLAGEGVATRKWDGTACLIKDGALFKRYDRKKGKTPEGFIPCEPEPDTVTRHWPGWLPVTVGPEDQWHRLALQAHQGSCECYGVPVADGTYELVGPKVQGNAEDQPNHILLRHGASVLPTIPLSFEGIREFLATHPIEGIVWHHPDGRMAKVKRKDFGLPWPVR